MPAIPRFNAHEDSSALRANPAFSSGKAAYASGTQETTMIVPSNFCEQLLSLNRLQLISQHVHLRRVLLHNASQQCRDALGIFLFLYVVELVYSLSFLMELILQGYI
ncbi:MAG: hypothetical protein EZS28_029321 [Streblomastix strix]|uniref:Uncharacterized protein n=1 Tax=Streblomastix strix TaxID=222440 RepID=A0A5J4UY51_9EUKA|nr:MAG: hypothetical protein EZS28_029321 [Streblomastix strix]